MWINFDSQVFNFLSFPPLNVIESNKFASLGKLFLTYFILAAICLNFSQKVGLILESKLIHVGIYDLLKALKILNKDASRSTVTTG